MEPAAPNLIALAAAVYVTTCVVTATVRWFHVCRPYNTKARYYYPGRPFVTGVWLSSLTLVPYVLHPEDADAWFLAQIFFLPVILYHFSLILFSYFGSVMQWKKWRRPMMIAGVPVVLVLLAATVMAVWPGEQMGGTRLATFVLYILGMLVTALCVSSVAVVYVWANRFDPDDFSNPADFPVTQARRWLAILLVNALLCWAGTLLNSRAVLAVIQLIIAMSCVLVLIPALHPHRHRSPEEPSAAVPAGKGALPKMKQAEILAAIRTVVEERAGFLDPHLTLQDVADDCGYNRTYVSTIVKREFGGFVDYINRLRLAYVEDYQHRHSDATLGEAIEAAGFGSRSRYYDAKARLQA